MEPTIALVFCGSRALFRGETGHEDVVFPGGAFEDPFMMGSRTVASLWAVMVKAD